MEAVALALGQPWQSIFRLNISLPGTETGAVFHRLDSTCGADSNIAEDQNYFTSETRIGGVQRGCRARKALTKAHCFDDACRSLHYLAAIGS
jgi:hypothetical protein